MNKGIVTTMIHYERENCCFIRKQINKLIGETKEAGYSLVPLKIYLKNGFAKVLIGLAKGKKNYDKREDLKKKEAKRDIDRAFRERQKM